MYLLSVDHLTIKLQNKTLVEGVYFHIRSREILSIIGRSGAGKSITACALVNLLPSTFSASGTLRVHGKIAIIFQESSLNPLHTIEQHFKKILSRKGFQERFKELLAFVDMSFIDSKAYPHQLSAGEKQRIMIALALALDPNILIADEPTASLDQKTQTHIKELFRKLKEKCSIILISHTISMAKDLADRIIVMHQGRIVETNTTENILKDPIHPQTKALIHRDAQAYKTAIHLDAPILLMVRDLKVKLQNKIILNRVSFDLRKGETLGMIGESGAGKTTLAHAILRLISF